MAEREVRPLTRQDMLYKWTIYGLALLPVFAELAKWGETYLDP